MDRLEKRGPNMERFCSEWGQKSPVRISDQLMSDQQPPSHLDISTRCSHSDRREVICSETSILARSVQTWVILLRKLSPFYQYSLRRPGVIGLRKRFHALFHQPSRKSLSFVCRFIADRDAERIRSLPIFLYRRSVAVPKL